MWHIPDYIDPASVDTEWRPPTDEPFVYHFLSQHTHTDSKRIPVGVSGVTYTVPGATQPRIVYDPQVRATVLISRWTVPENIDQDSVDFTWHPNAFDPPYIYHFKSQHNSPCGLVYTVPGATEIKIVDYFTVRTKEDRANWTVPDYIDTGSIDFTWHPDNLEEPFVYHFASQHHESSGVTYRTPGATKIKLANDFVVRSRADKTRWTIPTYVDSNTVDFTWHPSGLDQPYIYHFSSKHQTSSGLIYAVAGAEKIKIVANLDFQTVADKSKWRVPDAVDPDSVDFTWHPDSFDAPYIYNFRSQHGTVSGVQYQVPGAKSIKFVDGVTVKTKASTINWHIPDYIEPDSIDFTWRPNAFDDPYIYHFPSQHQKHSGVTYTVPGATKIKFVSPFVVTSKKQDKWLVPNNIDATDFDFTWHPDAVEPDYEYHFATQWQPAGGPVFAGTAGIKCTSKQVARAVADMSKWTVPESIDTEGFDFSWHPNPLELPYEYHFATQWQKDGGPVYKGTAGIKYIAEQRAYSTATQIFYMDFLNPTSKENLETLRKQYPDIKSTRYVSDHLTVLKRIVNLAETRFVWIISSICDYADFDFTWHPEPWQEEMIHVFPSDEQKRGDTFYINVNSFKTQMHDLDLLDWFNVIAYQTDQKVKRHKPDMVVYQGDDLVSVIKNHDFKSPYAVFSNLPWGIAVNDQCLWTEKDRKVKSLSSSNGTTLAPRDIKKYLKTQVYDYPHLDDQKENTNVYIERPVDIVYISNNEPDAERWYTHLDTVMNQEQQGFPKLKHSNTVKRVKNVDGRTAAYQAAARASETDWFFAVFAKLEVDKDFDWSWQPDMWQEPKHYIFKARNPMNGLEYGHMAMIAYNKKLVLSNDGTGLDFTLNQPHETVPVLCGTAHFNQDPWTTWRTAFREVVKLKHFDSIQPTVENSYRLKVWTTRAEGNYAEWCLQGANDAVEYYKSVQGDYQKLMLTYEWAWLKQYFDAKY